MTLQEEIKQRRPFGSLEEEAFLNLARTAAFLSDRLEKALKPGGITGTQYNVLRILKGSGEAGLCRNDVRDRMITRMPDMTRLLDRMEAAGLLERRRSTEDRRMVTTHITDKGLAALELIDDEIAEEHRRSLGHLTKGELERLIELLSAARRAQ